MSQKKDRTLNLRVDSRLDFAVDHASRVRGWTKQHFAELALVAAANEARDEHGRTWRDYWDEDEAVRELGLLTDGPFPRDVDDERKLEFIEAHKDFFFDGRGYNRAAIKVLWPHVPALVKAWRDARSDDYQGAAERMRELLSDAGVEREF